MMKLKVGLCSALLALTSTTTFADTSTSVSSHEEPSQLREHRSQERLRLVTQVVDNPPRFVERYYRQDGSLAKVAVMRLRTDMERRWAELSDQWNRERSSGNLSGTPVVTLEDVDWDSPLDWANTPGGRLQQWYGEDGRTVVFERRNVGPRVEHRSQKLHWRSGEGVAPGEQAAQPPASASPTRASTPPNTSFDIDPSEAPAQITASSSKVEGSSPAKPAGPALEDMTLDQLATHLQNRMNLIESVHGYGKNKAVATLRSKMEAAGVGSGLQFCSSWGDWQALIVINESRPRLRPTIGRLKQASGKELSRSQREDLRAEALRALAVAGEIERALDFRMKGLVVSAQIWDREQYLKEIERTAKAAEKPRIRQMEQELDIIKRMNSKSLKSWREMIESLPYPGQEAG